jgi:hypothetical protein
MTVTKIVDGLCCRSTYDGACVRLNWHPVESVSGYNVYRSPLVYGGFEKISTFLIPGLTYFDTPSTLTIENYWYYKVNAQDGDGEGPLSEPFAYEVYEVFDMVPMINGLSWQNLI